MAYNANVEKLRDREYPMMQDKVYLDHGGTTLYARSLIDDFSRKMMDNLYGNPHSHSDPARHSSNMVEETREAALAFFRADPKHFDLVFTANATAAIKLVGESFRDLTADCSTTDKFFYGYHHDAHTSVVGVREFTNGNHHCFASDDEVENWLSGTHATAKVPNKAGVPGLFAYPGQSNMTGRRLPLSWSRRLRQSTKSHHQDTYSLLDAAALATTTQLDFSDPETAPDFTAVSFYKIFGFPDLGALIIRKSSGHILSWRRYFGGGTVSMLTVLNEPTVQRKDTSLHDALEDGTLPFHNIMALGCAIKVHAKLFESMKNVSLHTNFLAQHLYLRMTSLRHYNRLPVCVIHNDVDESNPYGDITTQGATIAFSVMRSDGTFVGYSEVEKRANREGIYVRAGGLCNPGGVSKYLKVHPWQYKRAWSAGHRCGEESTQIINGQPTGVVRVSLGAMSTLSDVDTFLEFLAVVFESKADIMEDGIKNGSEFDNRISRTDSGFHSRNSSSITSPVPQMIVKHTVMPEDSLLPTELQSKPLPQQSPIIEKNDTWQVTSPVYDPPRLHPAPKQALATRPHTTTPREDVPATSLGYNFTSTAPASTGHLTSSIDDMSKQPQTAYSHITRENNGRGNWVKRSRFRFWKGKRTQGVYAST